MGDENDQPDHECQRASGKSNKHQPAKHPERIEKLAIIFSADNARMDRAFIHVTTVRVGDSIGANVTRRIRTRTIQ
jgi:hypothetical protein